VKIVNELARPVRIWWLKATVPCETWPCRRCGNAGRSSWRSRKVWHDSLRPVAGFIARFGRKV